MRELVRGQNGYTTDCPRNYQWGIPSKTADPLRLCFPQPQSVMAKSVIRVALQLASLPSERNTKIEIIRHFSGRPIR
jgi:hypothetical protein